MAGKLLSIPQYTVLIGKSINYVSQILNKRGRNWRKNLPGIIRVQYVGTYRILQVQRAWYKMMMDAKEDDNID